MSPSFRSLPALPETFLFGVGNSDHQCEAYDAHYEDVQDIFDQRCARPGRGKATDFWNRYQEDIRLAGELGCKVFRFSTSWARIEPLPGEFNTVALDHYADVVEAILAAGMEPMITLVHFAWPIHVEQQGGMTSPHFPALFTRYTTRVADHLGKRVKYWITFNEPSILTFGYIKPWWIQTFSMPPGRSDDAAITAAADDIGKLIPNLFRSHKAAREAIKSVNPEALVSANAALLGLPIWLQRLLDRKATQLQSREKLARAGNRFSNRPVQEYGKVDMVAATFTVTPDRQEQVDFSGVYYVASQALLVPADSKLNDGPYPAGLSIAVVKGATAATAVSTLFPTAKPVVSLDMPAALSALDSKQADALLTDDTVIAGIMKQSPGRYRVAATGLTREPYAVAVTKGHPLWLQTVSDVVKEFNAQGARAASDTPVVPNIPGAKALPSAPPGTQMRRIQDRGHIIVGVKEDVPGFGYLDPKTGERSGIEIDLARAVACRVFGDPNKVVFRRTDTGKRIGLLRSALQFFDRLFKMYSILSSGLNSNWWYLGMSGQLPTYLCPHECVGQLDFVGFDYYWGINTLRISRIVELVEALFGAGYRNAPVFPGALYQLIKYYADQFPNIPIFIIENGSVTTADGLSRAQYIREHVYEVQRAAAEGVKMGAYLCWSITTNREWGLKADPDSDFGLYHIDLDTDADLKRVATDTVAAYSQIIAARGVMSDPLLPAPARVS